MASQYANHSERSTSRELTLVLSFALHDAGLVLHRPCIKEETGRPSGRRIVFQ